MTISKLADIQSGKPGIELPIDKVGVNGLVFRLTLRDRAEGKQTVTATAALGVNLPATRKGTHMSRLVEALDTWQEELGCQSMRRLLAGIQKNLDATHAFAQFQFAYLLRKSAPVSNYPASQSYNCTVSASLSADTLTFSLGLEVPVMTVCPCSLAISAQGAHCQRAIVRLTINIDKFIWLEDFIAMAESAGSAPVYPLLKREDEKFVTEQAFAHPAFVEDVARGVAQRLINNEDVRAFNVEVESMESIHNHNAFATISFTRANDC